MSAPGIWSHRTSARDSPPQISSASATQGSVVSSSATSSLSRWRRVRRRRRPTPPAGGRAARRAAPRALVCSASRCWRRARPPLPAYARLLAVACTLSAWLLLGSPRSDEGEIGPILDQLPGRCARGRRAGRGGRVEGSRRILWSRDIHAMVCQVRRLSARILPRDHPHAPAAAFSGPRLSGRPDLTVCEPVHAKSRRRERDPRIAPLRRWGAQDRQSSLPQRWASHHTERPEA